MSVRLPTSILACFLVFNFAAPSADARGHRERGGFGGSNLPPPEIIGAFSPIRANLSDMEAKGFIETGLRAIYPTDAKCLPIESHFGVTTRYDRSTRNFLIFKGRHGGADISAPGGTPLLAIADGTVIRKHHGEFIGGIAIWLQHAPEDTGLSVYLYTEYKHLEEMPPLEIGQRVKMGEVVGEVGNTGTTSGRAFGPDGYYHLHWTMFYSPVSEYVSKRMLIPKEARWMDPLAVFLNDSLDSEIIRELSEEQRKVRIAYRRTDGKLVPSDTMVIWPIACAQR